MQRNAHRERSRGTWRGRDGGHENNQLNVARSVTETHTGDVETFKSGDFGFPGSVWVDKVVFSRAPLRHGAHRHRKQYRSSGHAAG